MVDKGDKKTVFTDTIKVPVSLPDEKSFPIPDSLLVEWFNFQINSQLTYHSINDFRSEAAKILFTKAWIATGKNDSIVRNTDILRKAHEETNNVTARIGLVQRIIEAEQRSYTLLRDREKYFEQARVKEADYWEKSGAEAMTNFISEIAAREKIRSERLLNEMKKPEIIQPELAVVKPVIDNPEPEKLPVTENSGLVEKDNIVFKVQIGSFLKGKLTPSFKSAYTRLSKFRKIEKYTDAKNWVVYTIGNFSSYKDATLLKNQLILEGIKGAFVAAFKNGERTPVAGILKENPQK